MNIKFDANTVPIELLRTFVVRMGADTLLDAERQLGRTRHAIDADIKGMQGMHEAFVATMAPRGLPPAALGHVPG